MRNNFQLCSATENDLPQIVEGINLLSLDNLNLNYQQFVVVKDGGRIIGFGRIKMNQDVLELCSLGVLPENRNTGIGRMIVDELINRAGGQSIHVVCIIPEFFARFNFKTIAAYPDALLPKLKYCIETLGGCAADEQYVLMRRET